MGSPLFFFYRPFHQRDNCVVFVSGKGCQSCKKLEGPYLQFALDFSHIHFLKLEVDSNRSTLNWTRNVGIKNVPCFLYYRKGALVESRANFNDLDLENLVENQNQTSSVKPVFK